MMIIMEGQGVGGHVGDVKSTPHTSHFLVFAHRMTRTCVAQGSSRKFGVRTSHSMCHLHALMLCV